MILAVELHAVAGLLPPLLGEVVVTRGEELDARQRAFMERYMPNARFAHLRGGVARKREVVFCGDWDRAEAVYADARREMESGNAD